MAGTDFDIAISGAGPVGMSLGLMLAARGLRPDRIALVDAKTVDQVRSDPRSIALSYGSRQILEDIGCWPVPSDPIHQIHVSRRGQFGRTLIDRDDYQVEALGYVARYGMLASVLAGATERCGIVSLRPSLASSAQEREDEVELRFADGTSITAGILVQAEGGVFTDQDARAQRRDYGQTALIATVTMSAPVPHRAYERFTDEGPLAMLPQDDGYAMVWCVRPDTASRLQTLPDSDFIPALERAFGGRLGSVIAVTPRVAFPLGLNAHEALTRRMVAIGNAAQTLHPVAGQGLNLGLRDAAVLARLLASDATPDKLARYAAARRDDRGMTISLTDTMARIFASGPAGSPSQAALGLSLALLDSFKPAQRLLADHMMFGRRT
ncbi:MAG TPA: FAD-dependent monooxygenase [Noviherbaspirillum sp.]|jgi:2-octaprenyl-6-methoxyphenol hydroxylase|uniref:FAD-dependent monooxygenase n=1 Tax=Noviherbaspirillum sp. TaxID=1926288 RepID=UPI002F94B6B0